MKFSILIPTLNEEKYIGRLLQSLVNQTYKNFEVIIVDGKSTDRTVQIISRYKKLLDLKVIIAPHRGASFQRNLAAKKSTTGHLVFFDADTQPCPEFLYKLAHSIYRHHFRVASAWLDPMSDKFVDKLIFWSYNLLYLEPLKNISPAGTGVFIYVDKAAFNRVHGFDETVAVAEDYDLCKRLLKSGYRFFVLHDPTIPFSVRRLDKEGRLKYLQKQLTAGYYYHFPKLAKKKLTADWYKFGHFTL